MFCRACYRVARGRGYSRSQAWWLSRSCIASRAHRVRADSTSVDVRLSDDVRREDHWVVSEAERIVSAHKRNI